MSFHLLLLLLVCTFLINTTHRVKGEASGNEIPCYMCGGDSEAIITLPDAIVNLAAIGYPDDSIDCFTLNQGAVDGFLFPDECAILVADIATQTTCGCEYVDNGGGGGGNTTTGGGNNNTEVYDDELMVDDTIPVGNETEVYDDELMVDDTIPVGNETEVYEDDLMVDDTIPVGNETTVTEPPAVTTPSPVTTTTTLAPVAVPVAVPVPTPVGVPIVGVTSLPTAYLYSSYGSKGGKGKHKNKSSKGKKGSGKGKHKGSKGSKGSYSDDYVYTGEEVDLYTDVETYSDPVQVGSGKGKKSKKHHKSSKGYQYDEYNDVTQQVSSMMMPSVPSSSVIDPISSTTNVITGRLSTTMILENELASEFIEDRPITTTTNNNNNNNKNGTDVILSEILERYRTQRMSNYELKYDHNNHHE